MINSRPSFLVVDGNNIIHAWPDLLDKFRRRKASAHSELIKLLEGYQDFSDDRVVVVFDGRGANTTEQREPGSIQIIYSSTNATADSVIERLASGNAKKYDIVVATDDVAVQDSVIAAGGGAMSSTALAEQIERSEKEMSRWLNARRKK